MSKPFVAVLMGSDSDFPTMQATVDVLNKFGIPCEVKVTSAHRTPDATHAYVKDADARGCAIFIAAAGLAAHLAGEGGVVVLLHQRLVALGGALRGVVVVSEGSVGVRQHQGEER